MNYHLVSSYVDEYEYAIFECNKTRHMLLLYWTLNSFAKKYVH